MRLIRGYLLLGAIVSMVIGTMVALAYQQRIGLTPISVKKKEGGFSTLDSYSDSVEAANGDLLPEVDYQAPSAAYLENDSETDDIHQQQMTYSAMQAAADCAIDEASYENAVRILKELVRLQKEEADPRVLYKLAVCREALGDGYSALQAYQRTINATYSQPLQTAARLGQCRVWLANGKEQPARDELYTMFLNHDGARSEQTEFRLFNQLALAAAKTHLYDNEPQRLLSDNYIHLPISEIVVDEILRELLESEDHEEDNSTHHDVVQLVVKLDDSADGIVLSADTPQISAASFLKAVSQSTGTSFQFEDSIAKLLESKTLKVSFREVPFSVILDALLVPLQLAWTQNQDVVSVKEEHESPLREQQLRTERLLKHAISSAPEHPLVPLCYMSLATLKHRQGDYQAALNEYERLLKSFPDIPFVSEAWINVGKCRMALQQDDSLEAFHLAVDLGLGGDTEAIAQAYIGRIHLLQNNPRKAFGPVQHALKQTNHPELLAELRMLLTTVQFLDNHSREAMQTLSLCAESNTTARMQHEFAVLAGLIKNQQTLPELRRDRAAVVLLSALSHLEAEELFGEHWQYLLARGFYELGFLEKSEQIFFRFRKNSGEPPISKLFQSLFNSMPNQSDDPATILSEQATGNDPSPGKDSSLTNYQASIDHYHRILEDENSTPQQKQLALKNLGKLYQERGNHTLAIQCFTDSYSVHQQFQTPRQ